MRHYDYYRVIDSTDAQDMGVYSTPQLIESIGCTYHQIFHAVRHGNLLMGRFLISKEKDYIDERLPQFVYMKVTDDKYELPVELADTVQELADKCGVNKSVVYRSMKIGGKYKRVNIN